VSDHWALFSETCSDLATEDSSGAPRLLMIEATVINITRTGTSSALLRDAGGTLGDVPGKAHGWAAASMRLLRRCPSITSPFSIAIS
jgi:hypothetical protein